MAKHPGTLSVGHHCFRTSDSSLLALGFGEIPEQEAKQRLLEIFDKEQDLMDAYVAKVTNIQGKYSGKMKGYLDRYQIRRIWMDFTYPLFKLLYESI